MAEKSQIAKKLARWSSLLKARPRVLIAGILAGGTMIAFPAASAVVVLYGGVLLGTIAVMAWTGALALASVAAAALVVPIVAVLTVVAVVIGARRVVRMARRAHAAGESTLPPSFPARDIREGRRLRRAALAIWETDGGRLLRRRRKVKRARRPGRSHHVKSN